MVAKYVNSDKKNNKTYTHTCPHADTADVLLSQEVSDLHERAVLLHHHINGEMGIYRSHLVSEALENKINMYYNSSYLFLFNNTAKKLKTLIQSFKSGFTVTISSCEKKCTKIEFTYQGDPLDHVLDMTADGADCCQLLPVTPPLVYAQLKQIVCINSTCYH